MPRPALLERPRPIELEGVLEGYTAQANTYWKGHGLLHVHAMTSGNLGLVI